MKKKLHPIPSASLREALEIEGFRFPCEGKGVCGRCRVLAPALPPTALDRRFFTAADIERGMRLACDKQFDAPLELEVYMQQAPPPRKLYEPLGVALLGESVSEVALLEDGEVVDTIVLPASPPETVALRAAAGKNIIELYERYNIAKVATILVAGTAERMSAFVGNAFEGTLGAGDTLEASLFDMPSEEVYLPPFPHDTVGSLELLELDAVEDGALLLIAGAQTHTFLYKGAVTVACARLVADMSTTDKYRAVAAAVAFFQESFAPYQCYRVGEEDGALFAYLAARGITLTHKPGGALARANAAIFDNRYKTRLDKLARRTTVLTLPDEERFLEIFF